MSESGADAVLIFGPAQRRHRSQLSVFICTDPPKPITSRATNWQPQHPRRWEYEAQSAIRQLSSRVPCRDEQNVWVLEDSEGLVAVIAWTELGSPADIHVDVVGVTMRHRRTGGSVAREFTRAILRELESRAIEDGAEELYIEAEIYIHNDASQHVAESWGFTRRREHPTGAQTWSIRVPVGDVDDAEEQAE